MKKVAIAALVAIGAYIVVSHGAGSYRTLIGSGKAGSNVIGALEGR